MKTKIIILLSAIVVTLFLLTSCKKEIIEPAVPTPVDSTTTQPYYIDYKLEIDFYDYGVQSSPSLSYKLTDDFINNGPLLDTFNYYPSGYKHWEISSSVEAGDTMYSVGLAHPIIITDFTTGGELILGEQDFADTFKVKVWMEDSLVYSVEDNQILWANYFVF